VFTVKENRRRRTTFRTSAITPILCLLSINIHKCQRYSIIIAQNYFEVYGTQMMDLGDRNICCKAHTRSVSTVFDTNYMSLLPTSPHYRACSILIARHLGFKFLSLRDVSNLISPLKRRYIVLGHCSRTCPSFIQSWSKPFVFVKSNRERTVQSAPRTRFPSTRSERWTVQLLRRQFHIS
jgi:hypothetical protein